MAENSSIEWTTHTFNAWQGCQAVSPGCDHCYAETLTKRWGKDFSERRRTRPDNWKMPERWNKAAEKAGVRARVFCLSMGDVFDNQVPDDWRQDLWTVIANTPFLDWQILTKRPQNIRKMLPSQWGSEGWDNVWLGVSVENQEEADRRIPILLEVPAQTRFLSCEPLLGPVDLTRVRMSLPGGKKVCWVNSLEAKDANPAHKELVATLGPDYPYARIDWVIVGGESGPRKRPTDLAWHRALRDQCAASSVAFFEKQIDKVQPIPDDLMIREFPR